jgi:hypothetical protein
MLHSACIILKLHFACINHTLACRNQTRKCQITPVRVEITLVRSEITLERVLIADALFCFPGVDQLLHCCHRLPSI